MREQLSKTSVEAASSSETEGAPRVADHVGRILHHARQGSPEAAVPRRSVWALLTGLGGRCRLKLALTYALTLAENGLNVLYLYLTGIAIDAVLAGAWAGVAPLLIAWTVHLAVGLFRHVYDT